MTAVSCGRAKEIDASAIADFGIPERALVTAAGKGCAEKLAANGKTPVVVLAGAGNNAADAFCASRFLLKNGRWTPENLTIVLRSRKEKEAAESSGDYLSPFATHLQALIIAGVRVLVWNGKEGEAAGAIREGKLLVDGLTGTGLVGSPRGETAEIIGFVNGLRKTNGDRQVVAIDMPSGLSDGCAGGACVLQADSTLAIEPVKSCLYRPFARPLAGKIIPVLGVFPPELLETVKYPAVVDFAAASSLIPPVPFDAYKQRRGLVEIHAGSVGATGAAKLAVRGATAAGAGLIRVMADADTWPILAASETGAMVKRVSAETAEPKADAYLIGPGWGTGGERERTLERLMAEKAAFVLDADAVRLAAVNGVLAARFSGTAIATPHPGEFSYFAGCGKEELDENPDPILLRTAAERNLVIILKGHVMRIAAPDGRLAYVDGMEPILAVGGSGDVLAGLTAGIAARAYRNAKEMTTEFDPFPAAVAAAALLIESGKEARRERGFCDASEFAFFAGRIAGRAWIREGQP